MLTLNLFCEENPNVLCRTDDSTEAEFVQYTTTFIESTHGKVQQVNQSTDSKWFKFDCC